MTMVPSPHHTRLLDRRRVVSLLAVGAAGTPLLLSAQASRTPVADAMNADPLWAQVYSETQAVFAALSSGPPTPQLQSAFLVTQNFQIALAKAQGGSTTHYVEDYDDTSTARAAPRLPTNCSRNASDRRNANSRRGKPSAASARALPW